MFHDRVDNMAFNKQNLNAYNLALTSEELFDKKVMENLILFHGIFFQMETMRTLFPSFPFRCCIFISYLYLLKKSIKILYKRDVNYK